MKYLKLISIILLTLIILLAILGTFLQVRAQQTVVGYLEGRFKQENLPVQGTKIAKDFPLEIEVIIRSNSNGNKGTPDDPINYHLVEREIILARQQGYFVESLKVIFLNVQGDQVARSDIRVKPTEYMFLDISPSNFNDADTQNMVSNSIDLYGMFLTKIDVSSSEGLQTVTLQLSSSLEDANQALPRFMPSLRPLMADINGQGAHIVLVKIELRDESGNILLNYMLDLQIDSESWWMADGLTKDWFPHPPPAP